MKKIFAGTPHTKFIAAASALTWAIAMATSAGAAQLQEARVTQVVNDVKLLLEQSAPRPATISDLIRHGTAVRTGTQSRSELTFSDLTITRLGANTIFSFKEGTREMTLIDGAILFQVPKGSGGATIRTVGVTAAITGTTGIAEFHPATSSHPQLSKWLCLEGTFHLYLPNGQSVELGPGKIVTADGKSFSKVATFDIAKLTSTSLFFTGFDQPLASMNLIMLESQNQVAGLLANTTNPLDPTRIVNVTSQAIVAEETPSPSVAPTVSPTVPPPPPTPSKFGTPSVISSPAPYLITNGTVITTDPSIHTNGVTDYGKIYRAQTEDGPFSLWAFGSSSAFDTALRIDDTFFADPSHLPIAVFKFERLSLTGDPTIDTTNGVSKLGLIGVDGITSGPPGGTLTFTGLDLLLLATVSDSINLTSNVSFQDLHELVMYARGAGSDLTINSPISNIGILGLVAEDSLHLTNLGTMSVGKLDAITGGDLVLQIGGSLLLNGRVRLDAIVLPGASVVSGANLTLNVAGDYTNNSATESSRLTITNRDHIGTGGNIGVNIGADLTAMNDFNLVVQNTNGQIDNGGNITLQGGGSINVAGALDATLDNTGGMIGSDTSISITSSGAVTAQGDATFQILNSDNGSGGRPGQIGGNASIAVTTGEDFTANSILAFVNNHNGGAITSGANISFNIGGALNTQGDATFVVSNLNEGPGGGTIGSLASVDINAASISVGGFFQTFTGANAGGSIQGDAINTVNVSGDLTAQQGILVDIQDTGFVQINPTIFIAGGHIGGDATVTLAGQNITTPSTATGVPGINTMALEASIYSDGSGTIGGNAIVNVMASHNISAPGTVFFGVANDNYQGFGGGTIGGDAQVNVTANNLSTGALFDDVYNNGGGRIGRDAIISLNLSNGFTATGNAEFAIFNPGGMVGRNASIGVTAGDTSAPSLTAEIDNSNGGMIGGNAAINVSAANITANSLVAQIDDTGGSIGANSEGGAMINMNVSNSAIVTNDATVAIYGSDGAVGGAGININGGNYNIGGTFLSSIDGNGTITFSNASAHADVLKAGVFGANGVLNIGGGMLSADSTLKLYAPGSNGQLNFISNVTLGGNSLKILAANSITIFNNVVVTIGGSKPADVYTGFTDEIPNANYTGFGGNKSTTGTFAGAGANDPQPLTNAPPFGPASSVKVKTGGNVTSGKRADNVINVRSSDELLALLDRVAPGPCGKITIPASKNTNNLRSSSRIAAANRLNAGNRLNVNGRATDMRSASSSVMRQSPQ
jgi:hypothetical protein